MRKHGDNVADNFEPVCGRQIHALSPANGLVELIDPFYTLTRVAKLFRPQTGCLICAPDYTLTRVALF